MFDTYFELTVELVEDQSVIDAPSPNVRLGDSVAVLLKKVVVITSACRCGGAKARKAIRISKSFFIIFPDICFIENFPVLGRRSQYICGPPWGGAWLCVSARLCSYTTMRHAAVVPRAVMVVVHLKIS